MAGREIERLIQLLAKLPGLGPRSARRAALHLIKRRDALFEPLLAAMAEVSAAVQSCERCGNLDTVQPCAICRSPDRDRQLLCVVAEVGDLWALERSKAFGGFYHVLGGLLSPLDGVGPDDLSIAALVDRAHREGFGEVILALDATVEGQSTAHYVADRLGGTGVRVSRLAHGVPVGGELDYLDDGTLMAALRLRRDV